jgi:hypothetical protein
MEIPPVLAPTVLEALNHSAEWFATSSMPESIQSVNIVTPSLGAALFSATRRQLFDIGPEYLAFYTAFMMSIHFRAMISPLSHYRCSANVTHDHFNRSSSLLAPIYTEELASELNSSSLQMMLVEQITPEDLLEVASVVSALGKLNGAIALMAPFTEYTERGTLSVIWQFYAVEKVGNASAILTPWKRHVTAVALQAISNTTALLLVIGVLTAAFHFRRRILHSVMLIDERAQTRSAAAHTGPKGPPRLRRPCQLRLLRPWL